MTSTIGIPIKLLNEAQVRFFPLEVQPRFFPSPLPLLAMRARARMHLSDGESWQRLTRCFMQGHIITLEITSGQTYRGKLLEAEDNMNVQLKDITVTARDGRVSHLDQVYIRGSHVRFFIVPDMLRNAPMFRSTALVPAVVAVGKSRALRGDNQRMSKKRKWGVV
ncbi:hypothetical protein LLEC1_06225 [Akanthomyces lecanii]|uniref:Small nuclear ribonucleoprotein Sm D3 n=1 Tax=Cordyceps confragosa TaxID=2714763 RepID=A0A179I6L6_CORDF|nr:hypothetical protein LLEC1_06225 [Akanthomyces lecanii]